MHVKVLHVDRKWKRPVNHLDNRICPDCGANVHGWPGQRAHRQWHVELAEWLEDLSGQVNPGEPAARIPWTAVVDGDQAEAVGELE
jgi:hypothetical protein